MEHAARADLDLGIDTIRASPSNVGTVLMIVRRPAPGEREVLEIGELNLREGLAGDTWNARTSRRTADGSPHPDMQLNLINARVAALLSADPVRRAMAGDQFHLDLDLSTGNLPPGTRLALGTAEIQVTDQPHTGCAKFTQRFGLDAHHWINSPEGKHLNLRGVKLASSDPERFAPATPSSGGPSRAERHRRVTVGTASPRGVRWPDALRFRGSPRRRI